MKWTDLSQGEQQLVLVYLHDYQLKTLKDRMGGEGMIADELIPGIEAALRTLQELARPDVEHVLPIVEMEGEV